MTIDQMKLELERLEAKVETAWDAFQEAREESEAKLSPFEDAWHKLYVEKQRLAAAIEWLERDVKDEVTSKTKD